MNRVVTRVWMLNAALVAVAAVVVLTIVIRLPGPSLPMQIPWWALAALFFVSEIAVVHVQFRKEATSFSLNELPLIAGLYFTSPLGMVAAQAVGAAVALAFHRRQPPLKLVFNVAKLSLEAAVAQVIFHWVLGSHPVLGIYGWAGALASIAVVNTLGAVIVQTVISLSEGRPQTEQLLRNLSLAVAGGFTWGSIALLGVTVIGRDSSGAWLLVIPPAMVFLAYRAYIAEQERQKEIELLYEAIEILQRADSLETAVIPLLEHVRTMFRADVAEVILLTKGDEDRAVSSRVGPGDDSEVMVDTAVDPLQHALAALAPETRGTMVFSTHSDSVLPERLSNLGVRDAMVTKLVGERRVIGTIMVANRLGDVSTFNEKDRPLLETLARGVSFSLQNERLGQALAGERTMRGVAEHQALHDPLTKLANRSLFNDRVRHALGRRPEPGQLLAVMYVDLDDFKTVNDSQGHAAGDTLLVQVAERMLVSVRPDDTVARLGGDEFAVLMEDVTEEAEATLVAKRILDSLNAPFDIAGQAVWAHATIGIAKAAPGEVDISELLRRADLAMYTAKGEGKSRYAVYGERMRMTIVNPPARPAAGAS
jgi:diguanylate cyclase (GGDEF)-like protein